MSPPKSHHDALVRRFARVAYRVFAVLAVVSALLTGLSFVREAGLYYEWGHAARGGGWSRGTLMFTFARFHPQQVPQPFDLGFNWRFPLARFGRQAPIEWRPRYDRGGAGHITVNVPLYLIALPSAAGSFFLWRSLRRDRLRAADKPCPKCGYSLVGLAEGAACPECGKSGSAPALPPRRGARL